MNLTPDELAVLLRQAKAEAHRDAARLVRTIVTVGQDGEQVAERIVEMLECAARIGSG